MKKIFAIIVGAGKGTRLGSDIPKQFLKLSQNKTVFEISIDKFKEMPQINKVLAVVPDGYERQFDYAVRGGNSRQESVLIGLEKLRQDFNPAADDIVLIHDAARPFVDRLLIEEIIQTLDEKTAVSLGCKVKDSLRHKDGNMIDRENLYGLQTPQGFHFDAIYKAHLRAKDGNFTDDTSIAEAAGHEIALIDSPSGNFKITTIEDYEMAKLLSSEQLSIRTGQGFDVHAFDTDNNATAVRLCGIDVPSEYALKGHSDADVGLHAVTDALLGAISKGDIGELFPPSDNTFKDMDSAIFLNKACELAASDGFDISNIDVTLICEKPKISAYKPQMQQRIAEICSINPLQVNVKATTTEKLGFTGRGEGIAAQAIVTVIGSV